MVLRKSQAQMDVEVIEVIQVNPTLNYASRLLLNYTTC
jgi:hypothetical protein